MEVTDGAERNEAPLLAIGRQSFGLVAENMDPSGSNGNAKKSHVVDGGEYWLRENDAWNSVDLSQARGVEGSHRAKRQNCCETSSCELGNLDEQGSGFSRMCVHNEINHTQDLQYGYREPTRSEHVRTVSGSQQCPADIVGSSSGSLQPSWVAGTVTSDAVFASNWNAAEPSNLDESTSMVCFLDGSLSNGQSRVHMPALPAENRKGKGSIVEHQNRELQPSHHSDYRTSIGVENNSITQADDSRSRMDSSMFSYSSSLFGADDGAASYQFGSFDTDSTDHAASNRAEYMYGGRSGSCKRRLSTPGLADSTVLRASQAAASRRESSAARIGASGPARLDLNALTPNLNGTRNSSLIQVAHQSHSGRTGLVGNGNDLFESFRGSTGEASTFYENENTQRIYQSQPLSVPQEQNLSQLHSLFARNSRRSVPNAHSHTFLPRMSSEQQPDIDGNVADLARSTDLNHWSTATGDRSSNTPPFPSWGSNSIFRRSGSITFSNPGAREGDSVTFDGSRSRGSSGRAPSWSVGLAAENWRPGSNTTTDGFVGTNDRVVNRPDGNVQPSPIPSSIFNSSGAAPSRLPPSIPSRNSGSHPLAPRLPFGEGLMAAPVQSLFGIPFRGLHMLPADGEQRQRFLSEILSALEHAWRSEELSYEELASLDPSLFYGGFEGHDRHSDMRLDVDNMSYEELLALEERIGNVSTGLNNETITLCLRESKYSSLDATLAAMSQESDVKCSICQEEFVEEDELGRLDCGHGYHTTCIKRWLLLKNQCPICKAPAYLKS